MKLKGNINTINLINPKRKITPKLILHLIGIIGFYLLMTAPLLIGVWMLDAVLNQDPIPEYDNEMINWTFGFTAFNVMFTSYVFFRQLHLQWVSLETLERMIKYNEW